MYNSWINCILALLRIIEIGNGESHYIYPILETEYSTQVYSKFQLSFYFIHSSTYLTLEVDK